MAQTYTSYESILGDLQRPPGSGTTYDLGGDAVPAPTQQQPNYNLSGDVAPTPAATAKTAPQTTAFAAPQQQQPQQAFAAPAGQAPSINVAGYAAPQLPTNLSKYFAPLSTQLKTGRESLGQATSAFTTAAGPYRSYGSIGGEEILRAGVERDTDLARQNQEEEAARALVGARYAGPTGLDQGTLDRLNQQLTGLRSQAGGLTTTAGAAELLRGAAPGLTAGQRQFEARRLLGTEGFRSAARSTQEQTRQLMSDYLRSQSEAAAIAQARTEQEADISAQSRRYLTEAQTPIEQAIGERVAATQEQENALRSAYERAMTTGSMEDLAALGQASGVDVSGFNTIGRQNEARAQEIYRSVVEDPKYETIREVPMMGLRIDKHGKQGWSWDDDTAKQLREQLGERAFQATKKLAIQRQQAFGNTELAAGNVRKQGLGSLAIYNPLVQYGGQEAGFDPLAVQPYLGYEQGTGARRENIATADERARLNAIANILGSSQRLGEEEYRGSVFRADPTAYAALEAEQIAALQKQTEQQAAAWRKMSDKARKQYLESKQGFVARMFDAARNLNIGKGMSLSMAAAKNPFGLAGALVPGSSSAGPGATKYEQPQQKPKAVV